MFLSLILKSSIKTKLKAESPFTSYFFVKNRSKMVTGPLFNITKEFVIWEQNMSRDWSR